MSGEGDFMPGARVEWVGPRVEEEGPDGLPIVIEKGDRGTFITFEHLTAAEKQGDAPPSGAIVSFPDLTFGCELVEIRLCT